MLGHHRPGSEGNLASDFENQEPLDTGNQAQPPAKAEGNKDAPPPREGRGRAPRGERPPAEAKPPADVKPPVDAPPPADAKPAGQSESPSDQTNPSEPVEASGQSADNQ